MQWNIAAECISVIILIIIWFYSRKSNLVPSLKNRLFQMCFLWTFCAMSSNILSTVMLQHTEVVPNLLEWLVTIVYFAATPMMGMAYFFYTVAVVLEYRSHPLKAMWWAALPGFAYIIMVLVNPIFKELFNIDKSGEYSQGPLILVTYIIFYVYCLAAVVLVLIHRMKVEREIRRILAAFPIIAMLVIIFQQFYPTVILTGSAATSALLIIYLYLQNKQNSTDYLTGLPNRQEFLKMVELQIKKQQNFDIIVLSLRGFKRINDTYGQHNGDIFLKEIGAYLKEASDAQCLYRYGGDEFTILSYERNDEITERKIKELKLRMQKPWTVEENSCVIPAVIGVVRYPESADTVEWLVNGIEYAVARAKEKKDSGIYYCGQEMLSAVVRRAQVIKILEENLKQDSFSVFYQPIISNATGKYEVAESLLRIPDSPLGPLYPNEFIPIAEDTGLIVEMTYQVLDKACKFVNRLSEEGIEFDGVHVNFSNQQFSQIGLVQRIEEIIERNHTPFTKIKIEITESVLAGNNDLVAEFAASMQKHGVQIELDDFGTGYSNIVSVMNTPLDILKLDKSLIWSAMDHKQSAIMVNSMTKICHELGLQVLAEGVETEEQDRFVKKCGIDLIQGFLFAKPMPEDAALDFLKRVHKNETLF